jgi:hypothetical protein
MQHAHCNLRSRRNHRADELRQCFTGHAKYNSVHLRTNADGSQAESRVRIVYQAENIIDAHLVKNALEHEGIVGFVSGQYLTGAAGELPPMALVNVMVAEIDWPQARKVAEQVDADLAEHRAAPDRGDDWLLDAV